MPTREVKSLKRGDRVILDSGEVQVKAIHLLSPDETRIEWQGNAINTKTEYHPAETLQVMGR